MLIPSGQENIPDAKMVPKQRCFVVKSLIVDQFLPSGIELRPGLMGILPRRLTEPGRRCARKIAYVGRPRTGRGSHESTFAGVSSGLIMRVVAIIIASIIIIIPTPTCTDRFFHPRN